MNEHVRIQLKTMKEIMRIRDELYGKGALPPLKQVVPGKYYRRGDHSHVRCNRCYAWLRAEERANYMGRCIMCEKYLSTKPYPKQNLKQHNKNMAKAMVLTNSCDYERWS